MFDMLNWQNPFVCACVLAARLPSNPADPQVPGHGSQEMFMFGTDPDQANDKLKHMYGTIKANIEWSGGTGGNDMRFKHAVTILGTYPDGAAHLQEPGRGAGRV